MQMKPKLKEITRPSVESEKILAVHRLTEIFYYKKDLWRELIWRNAGSGRGSESNCFSSKCARDFLL
jgi:hypothetical protein